MPYWKKEIIVCCDLSLLIISSLPEDSGTTVLIIYCCLTNHPKLSGLTQQYLTQYLDIRNLGSAYPKFYEATVSQRFDWDLQVILPRWLLLLASWCLLLAGASGDPLWAACGPHAWQPLSLPEGGELREQGPSRGVSYGLTSGVTQHRFQCPVLTKQVRLIQCVREPKVFFIRFSLTLRRW